MDLIIMRFYKINNWCHLKSPIHEFGQWWAWRIELPIQSPMNVVWMKIFSDFPSTVFPTTEILPAWCIWIWNNSYCYNICLWNNNYHCYKYNSCWYNTIWSNNSCRWSWSYWPYLCLHPIWWATHSILGLVAFNDWLIEDTVAFVRDCLCLCSHCW